MKHEAHSDDAVEQGASVPSDASGVPGVRTARYPGLRLNLAPEADEAAVLEALEAPGEPLKTSHKAAVRRVGPVVVKECLGKANHLFRRAKFRRGWEVAWRMREHGLPVPDPLAYAEWGRLGVVARSATVYRYLEGERNVEDFMRALVMRGAGPDTIHLFLEALADAVNDLEAAGIYHADLSGKNIFTGDGARFTFIDLDAAMLDKAYEDPLRLKNHIQLYDSFCDWLNDAFLVPFIERMLTAAQDSRVWMPQVRRGQEARRRRIEELWAKAGRPSKHV